MNWNGLDDSQANVEIEMYFIFYFCFIIVFVSLLFAWTSITDKLPLNNGSALFSKIKMYVREIERAREEAHPLL